MLVKIHNSYRNVVAVCDEALRRKVFEEGEKCLDLTTTFFDGDEVGPVELEEILLDARREDASFNFVGEESCTIGKKLGLISDEGIGYVDGVPFGLVLL
jgi:hypothetical protein